MLTIKLFSYFAWEISRDVVQIKKYGIINPFEILVKLIIITAEDLSFYKLSVL